MNYSLEVIFGYSIVIGAVIGIIRFKSVDWVYFPFILLLWIGLLNEIISAVCVSLFRTNAINNNIYVLAESVLILWLFKNWGLFDKNKKLLSLILLLFITTWVADNFFISSITKFSSYFRILYSFIIVLMSVSMVNRLIPEERGKLIRNPKFLITIGFIAFFTCKSLIEIFWVYGLNANDYFGIKVYRIMSYINLAVNLIYALAILWMPKKREYTLL